jgi:hypothetical protein
MQTSISDDERLTQGDIGAQSELEKRDSRKGYIDVSMSGRLARLQHMRPKMARARFG